MYVEIAATLIYFKAILKKKKKTTKSRKHGLLSWIYPPETTLQQALLDLRLFIQTEYFVALSSCELQAVQIKS